MVSRRVPSLIKSIVLVVPFLTFDASVSAPANTLRADECLSEPDSPSPQGTHWYYRLDLSTQRKCWYLRAPVRSLRRAAQAASATPAPFGRQHPVDVPTIPTDAGDRALPSSPVNLPPVGSPTSEGITAGVLVQQSIQGDSSAPAPIGAPVLQTSTSSRTSNEADGPVIAPTIWPNAGATLRAQNPITDPINIPADSGIADAGRNAGGNYLTHNARSSIATIIAFLALGLAALCIVAKNIAALHAPTITDHREFDDGHQDQRGSVDEGEFLLSALSDRGRVQNDDVPFETTLEIRRRKDKLARLHQNLDRLLQSPTTA